MLATEVTVKKGCRGKLGRGITHLHVAGTITACGNVVAVLDDVVSLRVVVGEVEG